MTDFGLLPLYEHGIERSLRKDFEPKDFLGDFLGVEVTFFPSLRMFQQLEFSAEEERELSLRRGSGASPAKKVWHPHNPMRWRYCVEH